MKLHAELIFIFAPKMFLGTDFFKTCHTLITSRQLCILWTLRILLFHWLAAFWVDISVWEGLVNEDTLLRTHCCPWCFLGFANWESFVADTKCFWTKSEKFFLSRTQNLCRNKCCARGQTGKHLCRKKCVCDNVSSFARALKGENLHSFFQRIPHLEMN